MAWAPQRDATCDNGGYGEGSCVPRFTVSQTHHFVAIRLTQQAHIEVMEHTALLPGSWLRRAQSPELGYI